MSQNTNDILPAGYFLKSKYMHDLNVEEAMTFCANCIDAAKNEAIAKHPALTGSDAIEDVMISAIAPSDEIPSSCDRCGCPIQCSLFGTFDVITSYDEWMAADEVRP